MADERKAAADTEGAAMQGAESQTLVDLPPEVAVHDRIMDAYYGKMGEDFMRKTQERVHWVCESVRGTRILDVGCSQGIVPILLGREGKRVVGIDTDPDAIAVAEAHMAAGPAHVAEYVRFVVGDFMGWDAGGEPLDTVVMSEILEHLVDPGAFVGRAAQLLPQGGCLVVTVPFGINDFIDHKRTYYLADVYRLLSRFFEVEEVQLFGKWIGYRGVRRAQFLDRSHEPEIPYPLLASTEKAFYALERSLTEASKKARTQLASANERVRDLSQKLSNTTGAQSSIQAQLTEAKAKLVAEQSALRLSDNQMQERLRQMQERLERKQADARELQQKLDRIRTSTDHYKARANETNAQLQFLRTSLAFQLGAVITYAFRSPVDFLKTPMRLLRLAGSVLRRDASGRPRAVFVPDLPHLGLPAANGRKPAPSAKAKPAESKLANVSAIDWPECVPNGRPVVMAVMDEFTAGCFENDLALVLPRPDNWRPLAEKYPPAVFFIESAWKGNGGSWQYRVAEYANRPGEEVADMMLYASEHDIPTVFWNKEDPVHHQKFMVTARMADHVFTTDANMIGSYREKTGKTSVHALPFAAQPALHYPAALDGRKPLSCFAGSWYGNRHEQRGESMQWLLRAANRHGLVIYDRNHGSGEFTFPAEYRDAVKGGLPYKALCEEYRRYRVFLNVNSVTDSPTMFSRRVFELMACGTPVVSTYAEGIERMFESGAVWLVDSEAQAEEAIRTLLADDTQWRRRSLAGIREVFARHTYAHRLNEVFQNIGLATRLPVDPQITLLGKVSDEGELNRLVDAMQAQTYRAFSLRIEAPFRTAGRAAFEGLEIEFVQPGGLVGPADALAAAGPSQALGWVSATASYGPGYLRDLANAMNYRPEAQGWGKALDGDAFAYGASGHVHASVWKPSHFPASVDDAPASGTLRSDRLFIMDSAEFAMAAGRLEIL